jgi:hypothetical protein
MLNAPTGDGTANEKPYELRHEDGDRFRLDGPDGAQKTFNLASAIQIADHEAGRGVRLNVVDPETNAVLWTGVRATR